MNDATIIHAAEAGRARDASRRQWAEARIAIERSRYWVSPNGRYPRWPIVLKSAAIGIFARGMRLTPLGRRGLRNALAPRLVELELAFPDLPPGFDGYRVLHLSDTHLDALPELAPIAGRLLAGIETDLLALTGDVLATPSAPPGRAAGLLAEALAGVAVRGRRLAVLGNHDPAATAEALEAIGFEVLLNRSTAIEPPGSRDAGRLVVTGLDDVHYFYTDAARRALEESGAGFRIALVHSAEMADHAARAGFAFYLCGHTHGGQICLPGGRPLVTQLKRCRHGARGLWRDGAMLGYTSRGLGISGHAMRFNCPSEMTLLTLRRAPG